MTSLLHFPESKFRTKDLNHNSMLSIIFPLAQDDRDVQRENGAELHIDSALFSSMCSISAARLKSST